MGLRRLLLWLAVCALFTFAVVAVLPALLVRPGGPPPVERGARLSPARVLEGELVIRVAVKGRGVVALPLEDYVRGVVAAEMPASFHPEALKAQAVAARTYAVGHMRVFGGEGCRGDPEADVCADPDQGQAWASPDELRRRWGLFRFALYWRKIGQAVEATRGLILVYDQQPIDALFHAASGGRTEDAQYVWGKPVPYLKSVDSPDRGTRYDGVRVSFSLAEVARRTGVDAAVLARLQREGREPLAVLERTPSGRVALARVGDRRLTGRQLREALGLNSTLFSWRVLGERVEVTTSGYGHGVGMSQYGADALARQGADFRRILTHYYTGVQIRPIFVE